MTQTTKSPIDKGTGETYYYYAQYYYWKQIVFNIAIGRKEQRSLDERRHPKSLLI
jgi:hypothetical protein